MAGEPIEELSVVIVTADEQDAGTDNAVYFDIGPIR